MVGAPVDTGRSGAFYVRADDGRAYLAKGVKFDIDLSPYGPVNELLSVLLGQALNLPVNGFSLLNHKDRVLFGSLWIDDFQRKYCWDGSTLNACRNKADIYAVVAFDVWLCNTDRHEMNLPVRVLGSAGEYSLWANDHDRCLMPAGVTPFNIAETWRGSTPAHFTRLKHVREAISDPEKLDTAIRQIEDLTAEDIGQIFRMVPDQMISRAELRYVRDFVMSRRLELRQIFDNANHRDGTPVFPNLPRIAA